MNEEGTNKEKVIHKIDAQKVREKMWKTDWKVWLKIGREVEIATVVNAKRE